MISKEIRVIWRIWRDDKYSLLQQISTTMLWRMIPKRSEALGVFGVMISIVCFNNDLHVLW